MFYCVPCVSVRRSKKKRNINIPISSVVVFSALICCYVAISARRFEMDASLASSAASRSSSGCAGLPAAAPLAQSSAEETGALSR